MARTCRPAAPRGGADRSFGLTTAARASLHPDGPRNAASPTTGASRAMLPESACCQAELKRVVPGTKPAAAPLMAAALTNRQPPSGSARPPTRPSKRKTARDRSRASKSSRFGLVTRLKASPRQAVFSGTRMTEWCISHSIVPPAAGLLSRLLSEGLVAGIKVGLRTGFPGFSSLVSSFRAFQVAVNFLSTSCFPASSLAPKPWTSLTSGLADGRKP